MKLIADQLEKIIDECEPALKKMSKEKFALKPLPGKWSKKEVLGHLVDSAQNNIRRFICGQYEGVPPKIVYDQDQWVSLNNYQDAESHEVIELWILANKRIISILEKMPHSSYSKEADT